ncbi:DUF4279 domain-containing protein [Tahibacter harae]|uniref:DUF4279 domain-containing protein n=1 Tax=Tahibacter harae TaxID=2963937 RepID=A0ABT1QTT2_9GAMM|nr:DUF4279 domain-containing protein [Tahibacter harae]MCQ4165691.1 DUF4279 domain-containing protein [Tahibacter harae]
MTRVSESMVSLRILGDDLRPEEITALFEVEPSLSCCKGDLLSSRGGKEYRRSRGMWSLSAELHKPENVAAQVAELLSRLPDDLSLWSTLVSRFEIVLFCGLFMNEANEGLSLDAGTLRALAERGIALDLDLYGPADSRRSLPPG